MNIKSYIGTVRRKLVRMVEYNGKKILSSEKGNDYIAQNIIKNAPFFVTRIGGTELEVLKYYLYKNGNYSNKIKEKAYTLSGIFPENKEGLDRFSQEYLSSISKADCIGVWFNKNEGKIIKKYNTNCCLTELRGLEPYYWQNPWSRYLEGKKILIIHPFEESIHKQYKRHDKLFENKNILPNFEIKTIKAIQSLKGNYMEYNTWTDALDIMKSKVNEIDFDIAIIGAGAYGLPLGAHIKSIGKQAIHIGGATQILFGIKGKRWDDHEFISKLYNEYWIRPNLNEIYKDAKKVEGGCYW